MIKNRRRGGVTPSVDRVSYVAILKTVPVIKGMSLLWDAPHTLCFLSRSVQKGYSRSVEPQSLKRDQVRRRRPRRKEYSVTSLSRLALQCDFSRISLCARGPF